MVHEQLSTFFRGFAGTRTRWPSVRGNGALSFYRGENQRMIASRRLIAKMPTLAAMAYKISQFFNYRPRNELGYAEIPAYAFGSG